MCPVARLGADSMAFTRAMEHMGLGLLDLALAVVGLAILELLNLGREPGPVEAADQA